MDLLWLIVGIVFMVVGIAGCILPLLPGPPLCFIGLWVQQFRTDVPYSTKFLILWAGIALVVTVLDYAIPLYGTRKFGGSKYGVWGCTVGLFLGLFIPPWGIVLGPFIGAFVGELFANTNSNQALKAALGSFIGFLFGTLLKLVTCLVMVYYFVTGF
ncbi:MAG: DUF456 domain-containing protein [Cyclobacteriaceae bacterium]|nr:DUF456 domain-containing protein [Cyclobacteriaceae bacterium]